jgi:hypothetical protein
MVDTSDMEERRLKTARRRTPRTAVELATAFESLRRQSPPRRMAPELLAALTGSIESVAATAAPVVEATAEAVKGHDPARERERLVVALKNLEAAMSEATATVRAALQDIEQARSRTPRHK